MAKKKQANTMPSYEDLYSMLITDSDIEDPELDSYMKSDDFQYAYGTLYNNYIQNPAEVHTQGKINVAKAQSAAASNPFTMALDVIGGAAVQYGSSKISKGGGIEKIGDKDQWGDMFAMGTTSGTPGGPANVEGGEAFELPTGEIGIFEGKSHENGGIDIMTPEGVEIYSKRLKKNGLSHASIAKRHQRKISKLEKRLEAAPTDNMVQNTIKREKMKWEDESQDLIARQTVAQMGSAANIDNVKAYMKGTSYKVSKYKDGTGFLDMFAVDDSILGGEIDPTFATAQSEGERPELANGETGLSTKLGDIIGAVGTIGAGLAPLLNTLNARATDTPNINAFENYGQDALATIADAQGLSENIRTNETKDNDMRRTAAVRRGRNSASSVNTSRALDVAAEANANKNQRAINNRATSSKLSLLQQKAAQQNKNDQVRMGGEAQRDLADRQDKGAHDTAKGQDLATLFTAVQQLGKMSNESEREKMLFELQKNLSKYGLMVDNNGAVVNKDDSNE